MGIPIGLDYSWFLIFALLTWMLANSYYPAEFKHWPPLLYWFTGAVTAIMPTFELMNRDGVNPLPVMTDRQVASMLSREDVITFLRTLQELKT